MDKYTVRAWTGRAPRYVWQGLNVVQAKTLVMVMAGKNMMPASDWLLARVMVAVMGLDVPDTIETTQIESETHGTHGDVLCKVIMVEGRPVVSMVPGCEFDTDIPDDGYFH